MSDTDLVLSEDNTYYGEKLFMTTELRIQIKTLSTKIIFRILVLRSIDMKFPFCQFFVYIRPNNDIKAVKVENSYLNVKIQS